MEETQNQCESSESSDDEEWMDDDTDDDGTYDEEETLDVASLLRVFEAGPMDTGFPGMPDRWKSPKARDEEGNGTYNAARWWNGTPYVRTGPWSIACKHRCAHTGESNHAVLSDYPTPCGWETLQDVEMTRALCLRNNMRDLCAADVVTVYLGRDCCYGTYAEIGYAFAMGKVIIVLFDEFSMDLKKRADQWYFAEISLRSLASAPAAWNRRLPQLPIMDTWNDLGDYRSYLQRVLYKYFDDIRRKRLNDLYPEDVDIDRRITEAENETHIKAEAALQPDATIA